MPARKGVLPVPHRQAADSLCYDFES
jgi:hypothetical protein